VLAYPRSRVQLEDVYRYELLSHCKDKSTSFQVKFLVERLILLAHLRSSLVTIVLRSVNLDTFTWTKIKAIKRLEV